MKTEMTLAEFFEKYDLYDRAVDFIRAENDQFAFRFSLFHCDDPERDNDRIDYILDVRFPVSCVRVIEGDIPRPSPEIDGEILKYSFQNGHADMGISWRNYSTRETPWTELRLSCGPISVEEKQEIASR